MPSLSKRFGDRRDARRVREIDGMHAYMAHMMPRRTEAEVYFHAEVDVSNLLIYLDKKNTEKNDEKITLFHAVTYAVSKVLTERPLLNRFVSGRRYYHRNHISLSFVAKKRFEDHAEESMMILRPQENDTLEDFSRKILGDVHMARKEGASYGSDGALNLLKKLPKPLMMLFMWGLRRLDEHGWMPHSLYNVDPNQTTVLLSNLGSIHCDAVYHHLNNFGTNSIIITLGQIHRERKIQEDGSEQVVSLLPLGITLDERIADGFYFARSFKLLPYLFQNPVLLEKPLKEELHFAY